MSQLSKTFFQIENPLNIKKVMSKNVSDTMTNNVTHVKYLNKRSNATLYRAMLLMS